MNEGSILDAILLCDDEGIVEIVAENFRTKAAQEERDTAIAAGFTPVLTHKMVEYRVAAKAIKDGLLEIGADITAGERQATIFWEETAENGHTVQCKARLDQLVIDAASWMIRDLKKARSAHPLSLPKHVCNYGYHIQAAAYLSALAAIYPESNGAAKFEWMFVEAKAPYPCVVGEPAGAMLHFGQAQWMRAVNLWERCLDTGNWPSYDKRVRIEPPPYAMLEAAMQEEV